MAKSFKDIEDKKLSILLNAEVYDSEINRTNPTAIIIMIDQSTSMSFEDIKYKDGVKNYAQIVSEMINQTLNELIGRCTKSEGVRNYFDVCIIGYGGKSAKEANILWEGDLEGKTWVSISELKDNAQFKEKTITKTIRGKEKTSKVKVPYWFEAVANYQTPMGNAFVQAYDLLYDWIKNNQDSYPPTIINITDGIQSDVSDEELIKITDKIKSLNTKDGNVLILNCHIANNEKQILFPLSERELDNIPYSSILYRISSEMPKSYNIEISQIRNDAAVFEHYRGMAFNASMDALFNLIDIGTTGGTKQLNAM